MRSAVPRRREKRANNTGTVYFVASENRWRAQFHDGRGRLRTLSGKREQDVVARLDDAIRTRDRGALGLTPGEMPTVGEWMDVWLASKYELKPKTIQRYRTDIDLYIKPLLGNMRIDLLKPAMVSALYSQLHVEHGLAPSSVKHVHSTLSAALKQAFDYDVITIPVMAKVKAPTVPPVDRQIIEETSVMRILQEAEARGVQVHARWRLALLWGLRQGEALGLKWEDVDLSNGSIAIRRQLQYFSGEGMKEGPPKAAASNREFLVDEKTINLLKQLRRERLEAQMASEVWEEHRLVFCTETGRPIDAANDRRQFKRLLKAADAGEFRVHDARHTAITNMVMDGTPLPTIKSVVGHSDVRTTMSYVHLTSEAYQVAADGVARRFA